MNMSGIRNRNERLISSWPRAVARWIPIWVPYQLLRLGESVCHALFAMFLCSLFVFHHFFGNTDMWGAPRDRARERKWSQDWKQHRKEEAYWRPPPLQMPRKRRLSLPLETPKRRRFWDLRKIEPQKAFYQQQSPLGRLPEELRRLIYFHLVGDKRFHVQDSYKRFGCVECVSDGPTACEHLLDCLKPHMDMTPRIGDQRPPSTGTRLALSSHGFLSIKPKSAEKSNTDVTNTELLALGKTCRLLYDGYLDTLYTTPTFSFASLRQFEIFSTTIPPHRLTSITSLEFYCELHSSHYDRLDIGWEEISTSRWRKAWEIIANMDGLRYLHVDLRMNRLIRRPEDSAGGVHKWMEDRIFGPMLGVRQPRVFDVVVNWYQSRHFVLRDAPFTLERKEDRLTWSDYRTGYD
jgi:hypothetical protein